MPAEEPKQAGAGAGWRRGYAADCKAARKSHEVNDVVRKSYLDISRTDAEHDTARCIRKAENESPGALAGATGANALRRELQPEDYRMRAEAATALCEAIGECHPDDAVQIMTAAMVSLCPPGRPGDYFLTAEEDAAWWARCEAPARLVAVVEAALARLGDVALHLRHRKRLIVSLFQSLPMSDRRAFLRRVDPDGNFARGSAL